MALLLVLAAACAAAEGCVSFPAGLHGQVAPPTPEAPADSGDLDPGDPPDEGDGGDGDALGPADTAKDTQAAAEADSETDAEGPQNLGATVWLDRAFALWHDGHFAAAIDALHEAQATGTLNDAGNALAYWHIYLSEQALGHGPAGLEALSAFVSVAQDITARAQSSGGEALRPFSQSFDLPGRLARARATLNLAWAKQSRRTGHSPAQPVLVFDDAELSHFLDLAPPCAQATDARVVALQRDRDHLGRATAKATIRCRSSKAARRYFFAFIGPERYAAASAAQASDQ